MYCNCCNISGFSILGWLGETYENKDTLDEYVVNELMRDLKLIDYLQEPQCNRSSAPYIPVNGQGWNIGSGELVSLVNHKNSFIIVF